MRLFKIIIIFQLKGIYLIRYFRFSLLISNITKRLQDWNNHQIFQIINYVAESFQKPLPLRNLISRLILINYKLITSILSHQAAVIYSNWFPGKTFSPIQYILWLSYSNQITNLDLMEWPLWPQNHARTGLNGEESSESLLQFQIVIYYIILNNFYQIFNS